MGPVDPSLGSSAEHADKFFYNSSHPYNWCTNQIDDLWADSNGKTVNDPCPEGWRVPTWGELQSLIANYSVWSTDASEHNGRYFTGEYTYMEGIQKIFLPAAGYRSCDNGVVFGRGGLGYYWSSTSYLSRAGYFYFNSGSVVINDSYRAAGYTVRCVQK